jgi:hypothetical protein
MERRHTQSDERMRSTRWRLGGQTSLEIECQKTLPYVIEELHTHIHTYVRALLCYNKMVYRIVQERIHLLLMSHLSCTLSMITSPLESCQDVAIIGHSWHVWLSIVYGSFCVCHQQLDYAHKEENEDCSQ